MGEGGAHRRGQHACGHDPREGGQVDEAQAAYTNTVNAMLNHRASTYPASSAPPSVPAMTDGAMIRTAPQFTARV